MTAGNPHPRQVQSGATRLEILAAGEALFGEYGVEAISHRKIATAAQQRNNAAVGYYFGSKAELVVAIEDHHRADVDRRLQKGIDAAFGSDDLETWIGCLVRAYTDHLASLGLPSWYARFCARILGDPTHAPLLTQRALESRPLRHVVKQISTRLPARPAETNTQRSAMTRILLTQTCAGYEADFAAHRSRRCDWRSVGGGLIDCLIGMWLSPVTPPPEPTSDSSGLCAMKRAKPSALGLSRPSSIWVGG